ncbi:S-adenosyl-L-methionine-dependent methyltransferase [Microdochium trichocladiopsis]|uniref:S-adenosyl-L-methionine-dependent methyltransferase n=1 Tax=Microdochium trichocladiopsis TaxID=1682393 RepID=A0A9P8Y8S5_9PEZI|nr:S-adenosyl-L-methionine-dependent methyltransferase [Microdochium trichocladiopsis]KAH7032641.1 S-adenosyl-L-methionine-dependent methyltransferase [Microdochium trichocladiopsis]
MCSYSQRHWRLPHRPTSIILRRHDICAELSQAKPSHDTLSTAFIAATTQIDAFSREPREPSMPSDFEKQSYWHERFVSEQAFEWLVPSERFVQELEPRLARLEKSARVLHLGCGTSDVHNHLRRRGFTNVTNVDYEPLAIERSRALEQAAFGDTAMEYVVADATQLCSGDAAWAGQFDLVLDKSTADAISCGGEEAVRKMAAGVKASLATDGAWISMSYSATRFAFLDGLLFKVDVLARVPTAKARSNDPDVHHYCYVLEPRAGEALLAC